MLSNFLGTQPQKNLKKTLNPNPPKPEMLVRVLPLPWVPEFWVPNPHSTAY